MTFHHDMTPSPFVLSLPVDEASNLYFDKLSTNGRGYSQMLSISSAAMRSSHQANVSLIASIAA